MSAFTSRRPSLRQPATEGLASVSLRIVAVLAAIMLGAVLAPAGMGILGAILAAITVFIAMQGAQLDA